MHFLMTNDVEDFSITLNKPDADTANEVYKIGLPRLLDIYAKYDIQCTFYFTGKMAATIPESVELVLEHGHEIGCHGYDHWPQKSFELMNYDEQVAELKKAKNVIEPIAGKVSSFRAPSLRISDVTVKALEDTGFTSDSSIPSQRFDGPLSFSSRRKLRWLVAPRSPYFISYNSIVTKGTSKVLEIPISSVVFPFVGTTMRASPMILNLIEKMLFFESSKVQRPIVFIFHPNECIDAKQDVAAVRRSTGVIEYIFADVIKQRFKVRNMGDKAIKLVDGMLKRAKDRGFEFITVREYRELMG